MPRLLEIIAGSALLIAVAPLAPARDAGELTHAFRAEAEALESGIDAYFDARAAERAALDELSRLSEFLDDVLGDPHSSPADLVRLESQVAVARDRAHYEGLSSCARVRTQ